MIVDCVTYNGEKDIWDIHYNVLKEHVDQFIVIEFDKTFSGKPKEPTFPTEEYQDVKYCFHTEDFYSKYKKFAEESPNTKGADHWKREFMQKESIKDALTHLKDDDIIFIGDVDEVWNPAIDWKHAPFKLKLKVYTYWLNNRSNEEFWGTLVSPYKHIKNACLNHLRTSAWKTIFYGGWHLTSMGGYERVKKKLSDSYTRESYWTEDVESNLEKNITESRDFLGRGFSYQIDESDWPQYLKDNREKYEHLCYSPLL